ncbi:Endonuclease/exonuclease/phosphatase [Trametes elegans]|nr:Endonuclease/exonuclease/phosphatase [Trametes elegans]
MPKIPVSVITDHTAENENSRGLDRSVSEKAASKLGTPSPSSDTTPSSSSSTPSSSTSSSSATSAQSVMTSTGDHLHSLTAKGYSYRKLKWTSKYRSTKQAPNELRLVTWNVDFMAPYSDARLRCILSYLHASVLSPKTEPSCVLLQELDAASFNALLATDWVRKYFAVFPDTPKEWRVHYGNATLVSRTIPFQNPQMLDFCDSRMGRSAILVDIPLLTTDGVRTVRIANTHLESLVEGTPRRPKQLNAIADMLRAEGIDGGVVGGDMNMIGDASDQSIHTAAGLDDACLFPDDPSFHTWGYQPRCQYPPRRLDRVFFLGEHLLVDSVEVIGKGLRTKKGQWASDHHGLLTTISFKKP